MTKTTARFGAWRTGRVLLATGGLAAALTLAACGNSSDSTPAASAGADTACASADTTAGDELAAVCQAGVIQVSTDPAYPPQSSLDKATGGYVGFDIDVANEIAKRLGVKTEWQTPSWDVITAGNWNGRWDMSVGSMTVTTDRAKVLNFTPAYYYTPASVAVNSSDTTTNDASQLNGKTIGVGIGTTYQDYLKGALNIPGYTFTYAITNPQIITYNTDSTAIQDLAVGNGRIDAVMSATPTLQQAIKKKVPIRLVGEPLFYEPLAVAFDKSAPKDSQSLTDAVSQIVDDMHADGTLSDLSVKWYGQDLTKTVADSASPAASSS
jgi:polar amino acid transport system substrate-binding protein